METEQYNINRFRLKGKLNLLRNALTSANAEKILNKDNSGGAIQDWCMAHSECYASYSHDLGPLQCMQCTVWL